MKNDSSFRTRNPIKIASRWLPIFLFAATLPTSAGAPEWLRAVARAPVPSYPADVNAVLLLNEQVTSVNDRGEIKTVYRRAYKILRPQGREYGHVRVYFDTETKLTFLKAWCIPAQGDEYEVKEKDAVEMTPFSGALYEDNRVKLLTIPAADPGNVIGYEYEQKRRPFVLQDVWIPQSDIPVRTARFVLQLPAGWSYDATWLNHPAREPQSLGEAQWRWEVQDIPALEPEPAMPHIRAVLARLAITFTPPSEGMQAKSHGSWREVGRWYAQLAHARRELTPEIRQKVVEITAGAASTAEKIQRLAAFAQREIRYVAVEIGIGGYQPHPAATIFSNRYGDCKDKVTLLGSMLQEIGVESYYVLLHSDRGAVTPDFPSMMNFNHVIMAIRLPEGTPVESLHARLVHPRLGTLLFFDPTDDITPLGYLPPSEQASHALLVTENDGELVQLPLHAASVNRLMRTASFSLSSTGSLSGEVQEVRWGSPATQRRSQLLATPGTDRTKVLEDFLGSFLSGFRLTGARVENLQTYDKNLVLHYRFVADSYAQSAGNLLLLRLRVLGEKGSNLLEKKERKYPVEFDDATLQTDIYEFALPAGYAVDELPAPTQLDSSFAEYRSKVEVEGNILRYTRTFQIKQILVPTERQDELKKFYRSIAADERSSAVLKRTLP